MEDHAEAGSRSPELAPNQRQGRPSTGVKSAAELRTELERDEAAETAEQSEQGRAELSGGRPLSDRYPERLMPIAGVAIEWPSDPEAQPVRKRYERFSDAREAALVGYGFNTARAYWGDVEDIFWWAERRGFDALKLSECEIRQYVGLLRRRGYSENTIRRRQTSLQLLHSAIRQQSNSAPSD